MKDLLVLKHSNLLEIVESLSNEHVDMLKALIFKEEPNGAQDNKQYMIVKCKKCKNSIPSGRFCLSCGAHLLPVPRRIFKRNPCSHCDQFVPMGMFCIACGGKQSEVDEEDINETMQDVIDENREALEELAE